MKVVREAHLTDGRGCIASHQKQEQEVARDRERESKRGSKKNADKHTQTKKSERSKWPRNTSYNNAHTKQRENERVR